MNPELLGSLSQETLDALKAVAEESGAGNSLRKNTTQSTGLVAYDLKQGAVLLTPVITPLRNMISRVPGAGDTATRWKAITSFNANGVEAVVSEGHRGAVTDLAVINVTAAYKGLGVESAVTFEADYAARNFDDARAQSVEAALRSLMVAEERMIIDGNTSNALASTSTPVASKIAANGATIATASYDVYCVPMTGGAFRRRTVTGGLAGQITKTNADGSTDTFGGGNGQVSTVSNTESITLGDSLLASVTPVKGAAAYAWYVGIHSGGAAGCVLTAITTVANVQLDTLAGAGTQAANDAKVAADYSTNALAFDGIFTQALTGGGYYRALPAGQGLTADGVGGVAEIEAALQYFWNVSRTGPTRMLVNAQEYWNLTKRAFSSTNNSIMRTLNTPGNGAITMTAGGLVDSYFNKYAMGTSNLVKIMLHPDVVPGQIIFVTDQLPTTYPTPNIPGVMQMKCRQEYNAVEWPLRTRLYEYGVYVDEVLQVFAPFTLGVISNIANV